MTGAIDADYGEPFISRFTVQSMREHLAIIDALGHRDADAAIEALDRHLKGVLHRTLTT